MKSASKLLEESAEPFDKACMMVRQMEKDMEHMQQLMREAIHDFHGKSVLFPAEFLKAAGVGHMEDDQPGH